MESVHWASTAMRRPSTTLMQCRQCDIACLQRTVYAYYHDVERGQQCHASRNMMHRPRFVIHHSTMLLFISFDVTLSIDDRQASTAGRRPPALGRQRFTADGIDHPMIKETMFSFWRSTTLRILWGPMPKRSYHCAPDYPLLIP